MHIRTTLAVMLTLATSAARADTIDVDSTTLLNVQKQTRGGIPSQSFDTVTTAPAFEILSLTARDIRNGAVDDLKIVLKTWASYDIKDRRWDNGTSSDLTGDITAGYIEGKLFQRHLTLRVGRTLVSTGAARTIEIDGGEAVTLLPAGFRLSGYVGAPVSQRFQSRSSAVSWNPVGGDFAAGGRLGWSLALPGGAGRGIDLGASVNDVEDHGDPVRREVGVDARVKLIDPLVLTGFGTYSLYDEAISEAEVRLGYSATKALLVEADYRFVRPDLLLARNSILSVFSATTHKTLGGGLTYSLNRDWKVGGSYHVVLEPGLNGDTTTRSEADARIDWARGVMSVGLEAFYLDAVGNGYTGGRLYARRDIGRAFVSGDLLLHVFRNDVNGEDVAFTGNVAVGYEIGHNLSAVVAGTGGVTPFMENTFQVMAKLVYNASYRKTEVR